MFNSPETFSRAFKRMFGVQPNEFRKEGCINRRSLLSGLTPAHIRHISKRGYLKSVLVELDAFQVVGLMTLVGKDQDVITQLWEMLDRELRRTRRASVTQRYCGIAHYPEGWQERGYLYMAGIEFESFDTAGSPLVIKPVPPSQCARFIHKGPYKDLALTLDFIYQTWLPKSGNRLAGPFVIERYGQGLGRPDDDESEHEIDIPIQ